MSLIAHYPLNGNTNDYSENGNNLIQSNSPSYVGGKIGNALESGGFYWSDVTTSKILNNNELSIALWIYVGGFTGSTTQSAMIFGKGDMPANDNRKFSIFQYPSCNDLHLSWMNDEAAGPGVFLGTVISNVFPSNKWTHLCITYKNPSCKIYINGVYNSTLSGISNSSTFAYQTQVIHDSVYHKLNDYRFYNHELTIKEIKEIAKAKILHYTFNDFQEPTTNILYTDIDTTFETYSDNDTVGFNSQLGTGGYVGVSSTKGYKSSKSLRINRGVGGTRVYRTKAILLGDEITFSSWIYSIISGPFIYIEYFGGDYTWQSTTSNIHTGSGWELLYLTRPIATSNTTCYYFIYPGNDNSDIYVDNIQIEKKNHLTEYTEISRTGIIRDISGYENDCTLTEATTPQWTSDTKLGSGSYKFKGATSGVLDYLTIGNFGSMAGLTNSTISFWRKNAPTIGSWLPFCGQDGSYYIMATSLGTGTFYHNNIGSVWTIYNDGVSQVQSSTPFTDQLWHHYVITGVNLSTWTTFKLSGYGNEWNCEGYFDDVRVYATELTSTDILELYKTRAQLDNKGNLFLNELVMLPKSAFDIKMRYPNASSGIYTVYPTGNENVAVSIYCDMETEGGPWTLLVTTTTNSWTTTTVLDKNSTSPSITSDYSILKYADLFKTNLNGKLNYRMDATTFGRWGGIWEAPYTNTLLAKSALSQSLSTNIVKWDSWTIDTTLNDTSSPTNQIPWLGPDPQLLTTYGGAGSWWGTLVSTAFTPAPWMSSENPNPGIIWYWVK